MVHLTSKPKLLFIVVIEDNKLDFIFERTIWDLPN